jgi:poly(3-hydroxybutyrate) depolymerase
LAASPLEGAGDGALRMGASGLHLVGDTRHGLQPEPQAPCTKLAPIQALSDVARLRRASWAFTTRRVPHRAAWSLLPPEGTPLPGDLMLARVDVMGHHDGLQLANGRRKQLFVGDEIVVAYGNRYACNQFEALIPETMGPCHLVAAGGIASRAISWHDRIIKGPTHVTPVALLAHADGRRINVRDFALPAIARTTDAFPTVLAVVGTAMDSGKTQTATFLVRGLCAAGLRVGYAKITGTGAGGDTWLLKDAGANPVLDFTDAGLASTYMASRDEIDGVLLKLTAHIARESVDAIVIEIADGIFQRETAALLRSPAFAQMVGGIVVAARDSMGASAGVASLRAASIPVLGLSGLLSASPLQIGEAKDATGLPVYTREELAEANTAMALLGQAQRKVPDDVPSEVSLGAQEKVMVWSLPRSRILQRVLHADPAQRYLVYVPSSGASGAPLLVAVHGLGSNPRDLARTFSNLCEARGVVLLAPIFTAERHADYQRLGRVGRGIRADVALDRCVAEVSSLTGADARQFHLFGYSGGAQFAHRYVMAHPHRVAHAVVASAGWYTFPDAQVRYPYGIRRHRSLPDVTLDPHEFLRVPMTVLIGEQDLGNAKLRSTERLNAQQGVTRLERARKWTAAMQAAAQAYGYESRVASIEVPQMDHSFTKFCDQGRLAERVFDAMFGAPAPLASDSPPAPAPVPVVNHTEGQACGHG